jgi:hypothetical protein
VKNNEIFDLVKKVNQSEFDQFMTPKRSSVKIYEDLHSVSFDFSWLEKIEETLPFLDTIIRKPRKFIMQEEEIVPIEKAKKISLETIRHLAQHTNLIQDVDEDGTITPSSVLNVHKEESFDIYENRFIYSLLHNLKNFIDMRKQVMGDGELYTLDRKINYSGETAFNGESVKIDLQIRVNENSAGADKPTGQLSEKERLAKIELIINDYFNSLFIRELKGAIMVRSPIRKTNVILKDQNFKKVLSLWEFLEKYDVTNKDEEKHQQYVDDLYGIEDKMGVTFFLNYHISSLMSDPKNIISKDINVHYIRRLISYFLSNHTKVDEKRFVKILNQEFIKVKHEREKEEKEIMKAFNGMLEKYHINKKDLLLAMKK